MGMQTGLLANKDNASSQKQKDIKYNAKDDTQRPWFYR